MSLPRVLVYCQQTIGHRQIYCNVLAGYFLERGHQVTVSVGVEAAAGLPPFIEALRPHPRVSIAYLDSQTDLGTPERELAAIRRLQDAHEIGLTFFPDGDALRGTLADLGRSGTRPQFRGALELLFLRHDSLAPFIRRGTRFTPLAAIRRRLSGLRNDFAFFHRDLPGLGVPVISYTLDPRFVSLMRRDDVRFLPDIYTHFGADPDAHAQNQLLAEVQTFSTDQAAAGREIVLYFGTNQSRRGYAWLLKLVAANPDLAFLHCGKLNEAKAMTAADRAMRAALAAQGRLFESACFITDSRVTDAAFGACHSVPMPYIGHYGSSGVMIQAASYGKPTLVPDKGLMAHWTGRFGCGLTFRAGSYPAFATAFARLRHEWPRYVDATRPFVEVFTKENLYRALDGVRRPQPSLSRPAQANSPIPGASR